MAMVKFLAAALGTICLLAANGLAQPAPKLCTATFSASATQGALASADLKESGLDRLFVEMGPAHAALTLKGSGVSGDYKTETPELTYWHYMSIYEPAEEWLTPGSVSLHYSGFRIGWPEFRKGGKVVNNLTLTVSQGEQSLTLDVAADASGGVINSRVIAIDFEAMLVGDYPAARVGDHQAWRNAAERKLPISITLTDASNGKIMARGEAARLPEESLQTFLSGGLNALRDKFKAGLCD